jgi:hypothetical protein
MHSYCMSGVQSAVMRHTNSNNHSIDNGKFLEQVGAGSCSFEVMQATYLFLVLGQMVQVHRRLAETQLCEEPDELLTYAFDAYVCEVL